MGVQIMSFQRNRTCEGQADKSPAAVTCSAVCQGTPDLLYQVAKVVKGAPQEVQQVSSMIPTTRLMHKKEGSPQGATSGVSTRGGLVSLSVRKKRKASTFAIGKDKSFCGKRDALPSDAEKTIDANILAREAGLDAQPDVVEGILTQRDLPTPEDERQEQQHLEDGETNTDIGESHGRPHSCVGARENGNFFGGRFDEKEVKGEGKVGLRAMERARSTLEDFHSTYFMFHGMEARFPKDIFRHLPVLMYVEAFIYSVDQQNEDLLLSSPSHPHKDSKTLEGTKSLSVFPPPKTEQGHPLLCATNGPKKLQEGGSNKIGVANEQEGRRSGRQGVEEKMQAKCKWGVGEARSGCGEGESALVGLARELEKRGLLTERISKELCQGEEYWSLERKLCLSLAAKQPVNINDVLKGIGLKSFDYRVLNLILYQLRGQDVNEEHFEFLALSELLVEIGDDLFDYEEDVLANTFNVLRLFVAHYGPETGPLEMAAFISTKEKEYGAMLERLEPTLKKQFLTRCEEATRQGYEGADRDFSKRTPLGAWTIPPVILDEEAYRQRVALD
eukprot:TRINITY_DN1399_c0_g2_i1.p1 TRINITY_DN1399_c0_g2~~TRINITY_DN1399_c0_g2_i1.p1  ORF type:complete len:559 (+),score=85.32 TRINITY_DN1399_c0_g2_i1:370-2046(+)